MKDREAIIAELERIAATGEDGRRYVRMCDACRVIGVTNDAVQYWEKKGYIKPLRIRVPSYLKFDGNGRLMRGAALRGRITAIPLDQLIDRVRRLRIAHPWTPADDELILQHLGYRSYEWLAEQIGCTVVAVKHHAYNVLRTNLKSNQGLYTTGEIARIVGKHLSTVVFWCKRSGLPHRRLPSGGGNHCYLIDPVDLLAWLKTRPVIAKRIKTQAMRHLEHLASCRFHEASGRAA